MMDPATDKQIKFMQSLGMPVPSRLTKQEAKEMIQERLSEDEKPEVVKPAARNGNGKEYHAAIETCRMKALECAIANCSDANTEHRLETARKFFKWIYYGD